MSQRLSRNHGRVPMVLGVVAALLVWPDFAWAYLDPGTGSYLFQMAIGGFIASMFTLRLYWQKVKDWARRLRGGQVEVKPGDPPGSSPPAEPPAAS